MTLPFFGSGIVELPPEGFKRAKNSRKMQMVFFVHDGKVLVTVGPPSVEQNGRGGSGNDTETNEFAISKGGVWVVPRGMFYLPFPFSFIPNTQFLAYPRHTPAQRKPGGQRALPALLHLSETTRVLRGSGVCATSRRNNLTLAPEHRTSCVPLHAPARCRGRAAPSLLTGVRCYIADATPRVFVCGRTK